MRLLHWIPALAFGMSCLPSPAWAIEIETIGALKHRIRGYLVREDTKKLAIRLDGQERIVEYERFNIKIIHQIDRKRLEKLSQDNPKAYRDYAEELAKQTNDPEAKHTALRLFLIAAYLDPDKWGRSSLLSMSSLTGSPIEVRKYRAMAFLLDLKTDVTVLKKDLPTPAKGNEAKDQDAALKNFQQALRLFRAGYLQGARDQSLKVGVDKYFVAAPGMLDQKAFIQACNSAKCVTCDHTKNAKCTVCNGKKTVASVFGRPEKCGTCNGVGTVSCKACEGTGVNQSVLDNHLGIVLRSELWAIDQVQGGDPGSQENATQNGWGATFQSRQLSGVPVLSLETITDFDPRHFLFRENTWKAP